MTTRNGLLVTVSVTNRRLRRSQSESGVITSRGLELVPELRLTSTFAPHSCLAIFKVCEVLFFSPPRMSALHFRVEARRATRGVP
jgi:hypothetical protein